MAYKIVAMRHLDFACASSRSRASPYASKYKKASLHASMGEAFLYLLAHGSLPTRILSLGELGSTTSCL